MDNEIIKIFKCTKHKNNFYVYTSYQEKPFICNEYLVTKYRLYKNKTFFPDEFDQILKELKTSNIYNKALNFVIRNKTEYELVEYLNKLKNNYDDEFTDVDILKLIEKFKSLGYIDDEKYTKEYIYYLSQNLKGPLYIRYKLDIKGVDTDIVNKCLEELDEVFYEPCKALANNSLKKTFGYPVIKQQQVLNQDLTRAGFLTKHIDYALSDIKYSEPSIKILEKEFNKLALKKYDNDKIIASLIQKGFNYQDIITLINKK